MSVPVPTNTEFLALKAQVTTIAGQYNALLAEVLTDEARIKALEAPVIPPVIPPPPVVTAPGTVSDLAVTSPTPTSLVVSFTEVENGLGAPATYELRYAPGNLVWGSATAWPVLPGVQVGAKRSVVVGGLTPGTGYQFQLVAFRGTLDVDAIFGAFSNVAGLTTTSTVVLPPVTGLWPNEPPGMTLVTETPLSALVGGGWQQVQRQTTNGSGLFVVSDPSAPISPPNVLEFRYAVGYTGGSEPGCAFYNPPPIQETYFAFSWKPSNPWQNHPGSNVNKLAFMFPVSGNPIYIQMFNVGGQYFLTVEPEFAGDTRRLDPNRANTPIVLGAWHLVEWYVKYGAGNTGITRWHLDNVLQGEYTDLGTPSDAGFGEYQLAPTWGGLGGMKSELDYQRYDHVRISRR